MQAFWGFLPSLAVNFYRVWRKLRLKSVKSKYVNTSKNEFVRRAERCVSQSDVVMLFAPLVRCVELLRFIASL